MSVATYYCHFGLSTGDNNGTSPANAWRSLEEACSGVNGVAPVAGDTVLCRGEQITSETVVLSNHLATSGKSLGELISFVGVNSNWENDGVAGNASLNANGGAFGILSLGRNWLWFENFKLHNTNKQSLSNNDGASAIMGSSCSQLYFYNCVFDNCYRGETNYIGSMGARTYIRCLFSNMSNSGTYGRNATSYLFCVAKNCGSHGFTTVNTSPFYYGCLSINNGGVGFAASVNRLVNCVAHGNAGNGVSNGSPELLGVRSTNNGRNFEPSVNTLHIGCADLNSGTMTSVTSFLRLFCQVSVSTDYGYVDAANGDFNLTADALLRRHAISLPS